MATRREPEEAVPAQDEEAGEGTDEASPSTATLFRGILTEAGHLIRQEVELARVEIGEKVALAQRQLATLAVATVLLGAAVFFFLSALDRGLSTAFAAMMDERIAVWLAPLILGLLLGAAGAWFFSRARKMLKTELLVPEETVRSLKENTTWIKERLP